MADNWCSTHPCRDCTRKCKYNLNGNVYSECPKYRCDRPKDFGFMDCEHCAFIDKYIEEVYYNDKERNG